MAITSRASAMQNIAKGKGLLLPCISTGVSTGTSTSNANDGFFVMQIEPNSIGSTLQSTLQSFTLPPSLPNELFLQFLYSGTATGNTRGLALARIYKFGTIALTTVGNAFTHDAATFPVKRTQFGAASQAVNLIPFVQTTTAPTATAPALIMKTAAGGVGYTNQDGSNVVATLTTTYASATTGVSTCYYLKVNQGDSAVQDVIAVQQTASTPGAGAATVWGMETLCPLIVSGGVTPTYQDVMYGGLHAVDLAPAVATSGTATSHLVIVFYSVTGDTWASWIGGVLNA